MTIDKQPVTRETASEDTLGDEILTLREVVRAYESSQEDMRRALKIAGYSPKLLAVVNASVDTFSKQMLARLGETLAKRGVLVQRSHRHKKS